ncbi:MAG: hemolysin family protein [Verrucomicrobiota bacterium]|jgi:CBS domain containing-hemolysin-like protein
MDSHDIVAQGLRILAILAIVLVNGFFVAAEFAFVKLRDTQLDALIVGGHRRARLARHILQNLTSYLSATQLGITIASLGLGWLSEPVFTALLQPLLDLCGVRSPRAQGSIAFAVGFSVVTFLQIILGELGPKWFAIQRALPVSLWVAAPLHWFYRLFYPANWVLNRCAQWLMGQVGIQAGAGSLSVQSEAELRLMVAQRRSGESRLGHDIILNALDLSRRTVREVMRPRLQIVGLSTDSSLADCLELAERTRYSRLPLCEGGDLDKTLGVVHFKDLSALRSKPGAGADLRGVARKLIYVPETTPLEKLLQLFLERKLHMAVVVDEWGGTIGLVTLENILEELVGQIQDEFDQEKPLWSRRDENTLEIDGALPLHDLGDLVGQNLASDGVTTTSGWVTQRLGGFPKAGDALPLGAYELRVEEMDSRRVARLKLTRPPTRETS